MQELRHKPRTNVFLGGQIVFHDRRAALFCLVRDISDQGAKLELADLAGVPEQFDLRVNGKPGLLRARVIWRGKSDLGIAFEAPQAVANQPLPQAS